MLKNNLGSNYLKTGLFHSPTAKLNFDKFTKICHFRR